jgi:chromosome partitioning protein
MLIIAVTNTKGGVGKTTLVASLGVQAAQDKFKGGTPYRVALVDLDPMKGLVAWRLRRGKTDNPTIFEGAETAADAVERLEMAGWDVCIMDSPPAFLTVIDEMIRATDFTVIPTKASMLDIMGMGDMLTLANEADAAHFVVFNDIAGPEKTLASARKNACRREDPNGQDAHIAPPLARGRHGCRQDCSRDQQGQRRHGEHGD